MPGRRRCVPPKKKSGGLAVGWILLLLFIAGLAAGGWLERERIVARFPQLADVYALAGVPVAASGPVLQLSDVALNSAEDAGDTVITVRGVDRKSTRLNSSH